MRDTDTLHRIDIAAVKAQVTAAGFKFEGESRLLANPEDPLTGLGLRQGDPRAHRPVRAEVPQAGQIAQPRGVGPFQLSSTLTPLASVTKSCFTDVPGPVTS